MKCVIDRGQVTQCAASYVASACISVEIVHIECFAWPTYGTQVDHFLFLNFIKPDLRSNACTDGHMLGCAASLLVVRLFDANIHPINVFMKVLFGTP